MFNPQSTRRPPGSMQPNPAAPVQSQSDIIAKEKHNYTTISFRIPQTMALSNPVKLDLDFCRIGGCELFYVFILEKAFKNGFVQSNFGPPGPMMNGMHGSGVKLYIFKFFT
uniref:RRM domain-containing protein n=1 Tax=Heterorhabditis bacteriophora TaxID=37862 RepID=A0A1I7WXB4_HETBA